jgi:hypothetical protein
MACEVIFDFRFWQNDGRYLAAGAQDGNLRGLE